jgi:hypothetical protein
VREVCGWCCQNCHYEVNRHILFSLVGEQGE